VSTGGLARDGTDVAHDDTHACHFMQVEILRQGVGIDPPTTACNG
jgi:hypothetical protein